MSTTLGWGTGSKGYYGVTPLDKDHLNLSEEPFEVRPPEGESLEEAKQNAKDALTGYLASIFERNFKTPMPSKPKGKTIHMIEPEPEVSIPIILRKLREKKKLTQGDIAKVLGISYQAYQRLEKPGKSNPTLKTLKRLAKVFDKDLRLEFA